MILKTYTPGPLKSKLSASENRKFDMLVYIILLIVVLSLSIITSI